jgi:DNA-binding CsgD family transcriptional regulator
MDMSDAAEADREAILALIAAETTAFWNKNYDAWAQCWVQAPYVRRIGWWSLGGVTYRAGWDEIGKRMRDLMDENPLPNSSAAEVRRENVNMRIGGDMAWVTFDQYAPVTGEQGMDMPGLSRESRVLEKHDGEWKIAYHCYLHRSLEHVDSALIRVGPQSTVEWMNEPARRAIEDGCGVAVWSGRLRATARTGDQRLQAAIRWATGLDVGLESRKGAIPVVLEAGSGENANICWVLADSGLVHVSINDQKLAEERLGTAAVIFGLSPSQVRLAEHIITGKTLRDAAERLSVSVATVRTQLERMFDKTGVRSQPALVRVLLSVAAPLS